MRITFNPEKNAANIAIHGVSMQMAEQLEWEELLAKQDTRKEYGEARMVGYAPIGRRLYCVVFVDRTDGRRIISLRKANTREVKDYEDSQA